MDLKVLLRALPLDTRIAPTPRIRNLHFLAKQLKALHIVNGLGRTLHILKDDKGLSFRFQVCLRDDVEDGAVLGEEFRERFFQRWDLDAFVEVGDVETRWISRVLVGREWGNQDGDGRVVVQ